MKEYVLATGAAKSGVVAAKLLRWHGCDVTITDMDAIRELGELQTLGIYMFEEGHPEGLKRENYALVIENSGTKCAVLFVRYFMGHKAKVLTEMEADYRYATEFKYGAVTGINGKITITTMLYETLKYNHKATVAGSIGRSPSELVLAYEDKEKDVALELSNFQLLGIGHLAPHASAVCNLVSDRLDYMLSAEPYYESKMCTYGDCTEGNWFLRNVDDAAIMQYVQHIPCKMIDFSLARQDVGLYRKDSTVYLHELALFEEKSSHTVGDYSLSNTMIAFCMAYKLGVSVSDVQKTIAAFLPAEYRLEYIGKKNGVKFYNDSEATSTHVVVVVLNSPNKNIILPAGGHDKGISSKDLKQYDERARLCMAFGETGPQFQDIPSRVRIVETMQEALDVAVASNKEQDIVPLLPACSSYDQFSDYEVYGALLEEMVRK